MSTYDPNQAPISPAFRAWARFVLRFRWLLLALSLSLTGFFAYQAAVNRKVDTSVEAFLSTHSDAFEVLERLRDEFGRDEMLLVVVEGDVFSLPFLERLEALHEELAAIDIPIPTLGQRKSEREEARAAGRFGAHSTASRPKHADARTVLDGFGDFGDDDWGEEAGGSVVDETTSLINVRETRWRGGGLSVGGLLDDWPSADELPALKKRVLSDKTLVGRVVGKQGRHAVVMLRLQFMSEQDTSRVYDEVMAIARKHDADGFHAQVAGMPALTAALNHLMLSDLGRLGLVAILLIVVVLSVLFRHPLGVIGPLFVVVQSVLWTLGGMAFLGVPMTMLSNILPAFIVVVGIGDSVHILSVYRDAFVRGGDTRAAVEHAMGTTGIPVLFTTLTTAIGLFSFRFARVDAIQDLGVFGALGVSLALLHTLVFLPIVLSFNKKSHLGLREKKAGKTDLFDHALVLCSDLSRPRVVNGRRNNRRRKLTLLVATVIAALSIAGASTFRVYHNPLTWIPDGYAIKQAFNTADANLGGTADVVLMIEAPAGKSMRNRELMLALDRLEDYILAYRHPREGKIVGNVISVLDVVRESNRAVHENDPAFYAVPDSQRGVVDMMTLFEGAGPNELRRLATIDLQKSLMTVRVTWLDASSYGPLVRYIQDGVHKYIGDKANVRSTGAVLNLLTVVDGLVTDLLRSFGLAFFVITIMMILLLRDIKLGLIAMVPNLLPIAAVMGMMAAIGVPIDLSNILIASIAIGIAVDDTIHFLHQFRSHIAHHEDVESALAHSFAHAGRAMITTSVILVCGFMVFNAAGMANLRRFGMLVASSLVFALLADLIFAPALLRTFYGKRAAPPPQSDATANDDAAEENRTGSAEAATTSPGG